VKETPAVLCYEGIFIRDHWKQLTARPWWYGAEPDIARQAAWRKDVREKIACDWFELPHGHSTDDRANIAISPEEDGAYRVDKRTGEKTRLDEPRVGGGYAIGWQENAGAETPDDIDRILPLPGRFDPDALKKNGTGDLAENLIHGACGGLCPVAHISTPLSACVPLRGYEGFMLKLHDNPRLVGHACERHRLRCERHILEAAALGAQVIWIEECYVDMISPEMFARLGLPHVRNLADGIRAAGMKSVYYHCGDPWSKMNLILDAGADAVSFEESKKGFAVDIEDVVEAVGRRSAVLGNLDAMRLLPHGSEDELKSEIARQISAGRKNGSRFVMSMGSPVTPGTPVERVGLYCDLVHEISGKIA